MPHWTLLQYRSVFSEFYAACQEDTKLAIDQRLARLLELGSQAREPVSKPLGDGIFELRAKDARVLYYFDAGRLIIAVVCFHKDQRKVDRAYIEKAKNIRSLLKAGRESPQRHELH